MVESAIHVHKSILLMCRMARVSFLYNPGVNWLSELPPHGLHHNNILLLLLKRKLHHSEVMVVKVQHAQGHWSHYCG